MEYRTYTSESYFDFDDLTRWKSNLMMLASKVESFKSVTIDREPLHSRTYHETMRMYSDGWNEPLKLIRKLYSHFPYLPLSLRRDYKAFDVVKADEFNQVEQAMRYLAEYIEGNQQYHYTGEVFSGELY